MAEVALLGTGRMGAAMAARIVEAGHSLVVWNRTAATAQELAKQLRCRSAPQAADAVADADIVICMLSSGEVTEAVLLDERVLGALRRGAVVVDMATGGVEVAQRLHRGITAAGARFVDAPVSGSVPTVAAGQLLVMASGDVTAVDEAEPVLLSFAKRVARLGGAGAGQAMKLSVNLVVHTLNSAVSEALALAERGGVPLEAAYDVLQDSAVAAPFVMYKRQAFLDPETPVAMSLTLTAKDLGLITDRARAAGVSTVVAEAVRAEVLGACEAGWGDRDMAALGQFLREGLAP